jgi:peptide deformylase
MAYEDLRIIHYPDPRLLRPAEAVEHVDEDLRALIGRMFELMYKADGVGLAAPQVGVSRRLFILNVTGKPEHERVYINPEIVATDGDQFEEEGCLSVPDVNLRIHRASNVTLRATNLAGQRIETTGEGLLARVWQHEIDHLNGVLIVDKMTRLDRLTHRRQLKQLTKRYTAARSA